LQPGHMGRERCCQRPIAIFPRAARRRTIVSRAEPCPVCRTLEGGPMSVDVKQPRSRRALLAGLAGAAGALATGAIHRLPVVRAADGGNALLGTANTSTIVTSFENTDASESSLKGYHGADGNGVEAAVGGTGHGL